MKLFLKVFLGFDIVTIDADVIIQKEVKDQKIQKGTIQRIQNIHVIHFSNPGDRISHEFWLLLSFDTTFRL